MLVACSLKSSLAYSASRRLSMKHLKRLYNFDRGHGSMWNTGERTLLPLGGVSHCFQDSEKNTLKLSQKH